jgi:hypothetical protein
MPKGRRPVSSDQIECGQPARDLGPLRRARAVTGKKLIEGGVGLPGFRSAMTIQELGVGLENERIVGRALRRSLQSAAGLQGIALHLKLPGLPAEILANDTH